MEIKQFFSGRKKTGKRNSRSGLAKMRRWDYRVVAILSSVFVIVFLTFVAMFGDINKVKILRWLLIPAFFGIARILKALKK